MQTVVELKYVWFWPNGGPVDGQWGNTPAEDAFARTSRRVTERYSESLATFGIEARRSAVQMFVAQPAELTSKVELRLGLHPAGDETIGALVPPSVADMCPADRARLVLEVVDTAMQAIGQERGWPQDALRQARQHTLDHHLSFDMTGPWKTNPQRTRRARPVARITDEGWSELCFEVADAKSGHALGFSRAVRSPANSLPKFNRSARESRWADETTIERPDGWQTRLVSDWGKVDAFDADALRPWPPVTYPMAARSPLPIETTEP